MSVYNLQGVINDIVNPNHIRDANEIPMPDWIATSERLPQKGDHIRAVLRADYGEVEADCRCEGHYLSVGSGDTLLAIDSDRFLRWRLRGEAGKLEVT